MPALPSRESPIDSAPAQSEDEQHDRTPGRQALLIAGIVLIALNLRPALASVGPLIADIRADTGLSNTALGLLTTLPLLGFGAVSVLTPLVTRRIGIERTLAVALLALAAGLLLRIAPSIVLLYAGTAMAGVSIAFGNVLLPSLVRRDFPRRTGPMTSLYSSAMGLGATLAAGISVPVAMQLGWRNSLGTWAALAIAALLVWLPQLRDRTLPQHEVSFRQAMADLGRSAIAWEVAVFMGMQSLTFYVLLAWLPEMLQTMGYDADAAGWLLALSQATGLIGSTIFPTLAARTPDQRRHVALLGVLELVALVGLVVGSPSLVWLWVGLIGVVLGGTFGLALLFIVVRTRDAQTSTELSGMAQSVGYLIAATGPTLFGFLHDALDGWSAPMLFLFLVLAAKLFSGIGAARPRTIGS